MSARISSNNHIRVDNLRVLISQTLTCKRIDVPEFSLLILQVEAIFSDLDENLILLKYTTIVNHTNEDTRIRYYNSCLFLDILVLRKLDCIEKWTEQRVLREIEIY